MPPGKGFKVDVVKDDVITLVLYLVDVPPGVHVGVRSLKKALRCYTCFGTGPTYQGSRPRGLSRTARPPQDERLGSVPLGELFYDPIQQFLGDSVKVCERRCVYLLGGCERLVGVCDDLLMVDDKGPGVAFPDPVEEILAAIAVDSVGVDLLQLLFAAIGTSDQIIMNFLYDSLCCCAVVPCTNKSSASLVDVLPDALQVFFVAPTYSDVGVQTVRSDDYVKGGVVPGLDGVVADEEHVPVFSPIAVSLLDRSPVCRLSYVSNGREKRGGGISASPFRI